MERKMTEKLWNKAAQIINSSGPLPIPVTGTVIELLQTIMTEEQTEFILNFNTSLNRDELKAKCRLDDASLTKMLDSLMRNGIVTGIPSSKTGIMVYRLMPPFPGLFEFTLMRVVMILDHIRNFGKKTGSSVRSAFFRNFGYGPESLRPDCTCHGDASSH